MKLVGVDTGGTFTDFVLFEKDNLVILKVPSTPHNPAQAVVEGIERLNAKDAEVVHGSTVATNAVLERKGARVALITNRGMEDLIEIQRQNRKRIYELCYKKPEPLVPRGLRFGIKGRIDAKGTVVEDIDAEELKVLADRVKEVADVAAISLLFCFLYPEHEVKVKEILESCGIRAFASHEILPVFREYERTSTVVLNAYVAPKMESYLKTLGEALKDSKISIMQSNGGSISVEQASSQPVRTILSGPAGGVVAAKAFGEIAGYPNLITLDMGGTSTDVSLIHQGHFQITTSYEIDGLPVGVPVIDIHTIGAGGGSIARIDEGGALKVGPESAGADPGPVCYGKGTDITVCDVNMYLGRLIPEFFLGGEMKVYPERIPAFLKPLAQKAGLSPAELALGVVTVANSNMERAIRVVSIERGYDPREHALFVFGGTGALHAAALARSLEIPRVVVPSNPGVLSALGMLMADVVKDYTLTVMQTEATTNELDSLFKELEEKAFSDMEAEGFGSPTLIRSVQCRFKGQSYELEVPYSGRYRESFKELYRKLYHWCPEDKEIEVVNLCLKAVGIRQKPELPKIPKGTGKPVPEALFGYREVHTEAGLRTVKVFLREKLLAQDVIEGPAIVVEYSSTCYIPENCKAQVDDWGNIILTVV